ncbi:hypothetical protein SEA_WOFFORD_161 [Streptomyces phage Wofford]|uniref:Uncharacterized protein n=1 Tax=Streptomyces phage Wofford TaxID=2283267 RepID=A0A345M9Z8_9CAUD|nr:hypothetical protein HWB78_gp136 [Streptomyces phage Wollford]AXH67319.1 hypothetical protein SEA_WOFFORD_161 [Streptomyces phage Wollford]
MIQWADNDDPDDPTYYEYLGVAMSEDRANDFMKSFNPGPGWDKTDEFEWRWSEKNQYGWTRWAETGLFVEAVNVL